MCWAPKQPHRLTCSCRSCTLHCLFPSHMSPGVHCDAVAARTLQAAPAPVRAPAPPPPPPRPLLPLQHQTRHCCCCRCCALMLQRPGAPAPRPGPGRMAATAGTTGLQRCLVPAAAAAPWPAASQLQHQGAAQAGWQRHTQAAGRCLQHQQHVQQRAQPPPRAPPLACLASPALGAAGPECRAHPPAAAAAACCPAALHCCPGQ
mmetsp:Transcript_13930/g.34327  ORF Transcript_13930/g.34327 Transcript_13930/m.34327 type:complete len:204 (-) Transcript_13930:2239-2850(-)